MRAVPVAIGFTMTVLAGLAACGGSSGPSQPDQVIVAEGLRFDVDRIRIPAGAEFTIEVDNRDQSTFHNLHVTDAPGEPATELAAGPDTQSLTLTIDEPGTYTFTCDTHPSMRGTIEVEAG